ncbi:MAG: MCE family protein [Candidatus Omnitrophota bacterium]|jgi:phospholipid/cholesterol/gamma-HCH transport system substrate-binding protein|nr:MAG: MCE family protein [Candidatus Omnitrophota bacterium]
MIFGKTKLEMKVGIFVFLGIVILSVFVLSLGGFRTWTSGYEVSFIFNFVNGIKVGAPVRFAGVDVGEVKNITFVAPNNPTDPIKTNIRCWVNKNIKIPMDSTIWVNTLGLLGEKYLEIMPGKDYANTLAKGASLDGEDPLPMHEVVKLANNIATNLDESIAKINHGQGTVGKLLYDDAIYKEIEALSMDLRRNPWKLFWKTKEKPLK